jgi:hypothetical protein
VRERIPEDFFLNFSQLFLLGIIMVPICRRMYQIAGISPMAVTIGHMIWMTLLGIVLISYESVYAHRTAVAQ